MLYEEVKAVIEKNAEEASKFIDTKLYDCEVLSNTDMAFTLREDDFGKVKANKTGFIIAFLLISNAVVISKHYVKKFREE